MVHGYHLIMGMYGFWLPNDPRGSWSDFVGAWELLRFGETTRTMERCALITPEQEQRRAEAKRYLKYPPVALTGHQALLVGLGFGEFFRATRREAWACSVLPEHVHLVLPRDGHAIEQTAILLKGAATRRLRSHSLDPMAECGASRGPWARGQWSVFLETETAIENAIRYVQGNPGREGKPDQHWSFITPFCGLPKGGLISYL